MEINSLKPNRLGGGIAAFMVCVILVSVMLVNRERIRVRKEIMIQQILDKNWICYAPTHFNPFSSNSPTAATIREDLSIIKKCGFDGVITYESKGVFSEIPALARDEGLYVIQGIWGPADKKELQQAVALKDNVVAYCVGNEGLGQRYTLLELDSGVTYMANTTKLPVAISERIQVYFQHENLVRIGDWLFPIVHPHFANAKTIESANTWILTNTKKLQDLAGRVGVQKSLLCKEIGMPSSGDPAYSENKQALFLATLYEKKPIRFAVFEGFDRVGWRRVTPVEPYWGIYNYDRSPKPAAIAIHNILSGKSQMVAASSSTSIQ